MSLRLALVAAALTVAFAAPVAAEITGPSGVCSGLRAALVPLGYEQITVSTTAVSLTQSQYARAAGVAVAAFAQVASNGISVRDDGTAPTASVGLPFAAADKFWICRSSIGTFQAIRSGGADGTLNVIYYRTP